MVEYVQSASKDHEKRACIRHNENHNKKIAHFRRTQMYEKRQDHTNPAIASKCPMPHRLKSVMKRYNGSHKGNIFIVGKVPQIPYFVCLCAAA